MAKKLATSHSRMISTAMVNKTTRRDLDNQTQLGGDHYRMPLQPVLVMRSTCIRPMLYPYHA